MKLEKELCSVIYWLHHQPGQVVRDPKEKRPHHCGKYPHSGVYLLTKCTDGKKKVIFVVKAYIIAHQ